MKHLHGMMTGILFLALLAMAAVAQEGRRGGEDGKRRPALEQPLPAAVATEATLSVVLGRPTNTEITLSILSAGTREAYLEYGTTQGVYPRQTAQVTLPAHTPVEVLLNGLQADTRYYYRVRTRQPGEAAFAAGAAHAFHTPRAPGSAFTFAVQGDSHPERPQQHDSALYAQTLQAVAADPPDFYLTIGDDFSVDTLRTINAETVQQLYLRQRYFLGLLGQSTPLFLVNGNHEQAAACNLDGTPDNIAVWAQTARNALFPQPAPDTFYTGDAQPVAHIGLLRDYYAWTWGDALFVVIDPYWHSSQPVDNIFGSRDKGGKGGRDRDLWESTLGDAQYAWLKMTLEKSTAKYKFVFTHHMLGTGRGNELVGQFEWGGRDRNGRDLFAAKRPGWAMPLHQLFVKTGVSILFQGHDHVFARQVIDGVTYQTLPEPADPNYALYFSEAYPAADTRPNTGYVRVTVSPDKATVAYIRQYLPNDETADHKSGEVAFSFTVAPRKP